MKQCDKKSLLTLCLGAAGMSLRLLQNMTGFEPGHRTAHSRQYSGNFAAGAAGAVGGDIVPDEQQAAQGTGGGPAVTAAELE